MRLSFKIRLVQRAAAYSVTALCSVRFSDTKPIDSGARLDRAFVRFVAGLKPTIPALANYMSKRSCPTLPLRQ